MAKQFKLLVENFLNRGNSDGFAIRDIVKLINNYKSSKHYKNMNKMLQKMLDDFASKDFPIRVIDIKTKNPIQGNSINNSESRGSEVRIEIAQEYAPHRTDNSKSILVHPDLLEIVDTNYPNLPKLPDSYYYKTKEYISNIENEDNEQEVFTQTRQSDVKNKRQNTETYLQNKNIKIPTVKNKIKSNIVSKNMKIQENVNLMEQYIQILNK